MQNNWPIFLDLKLTFPVLALFGLAFAVSVRRKNGIAATSLATLLSCGWAVIVGIVYGDPFVIMRGGAWVIFVGLPAMCAALAFVPKLRLRWLYPSFGVLVASVGVYAFFVEPFAIVQTTYTITSDKVHIPLRIAVLADIQTDHVGSHERRAVRMAMAARPDLILLPGDHVQYRQADIRNGMLDELREVFFEEGLQAPLGVYAARGNVDRDGWTRAFAGLDVRASDETSVYTQPGLSVTTLSLHDGFNRDAQIPAQPGFHIAVAHSPDYSLGHVEADLLVAGHTHGGQVQVPFLGPLITLSEIPRNQAHGVTQLPGNRTLVVSRGIGMERSNAPRLRFLCRPEVVIIDVLPSTPT